MLIRIIFLFLLHCFYSLNFSFKFLTSFRMQMGAVERMTMYRTCLLSTETFHHNVSSEYFITTSCQKHFIKTNIRKISSQCFIRNASSKRFIRNISSNPKCNFHPNNNVLKVSISIKLRDS